MSYKIEPFTGFEIALKRLEPQSDETLYFLPENLVELDSSKFIYPETTTDLKKILKAQNISIDYLTKDRPLLRSRKGAEWIGPTIFLGFSLWTGNPHLIGISLNILSSYLYDFFKGSAKNKEVKFDIVIESKKNQEFQKITYEGSVEGIKSLENVIKQLKNDYSV